MRISTILILVLNTLLMWSDPGHSQENKESASQALFLEIAKMDSVFFTAFNNQDIETIKKIFAHDLEFYHDTAGLGNYEDNIRASERLFKQNNGLRRELVKGSLEVYPIKDFGAIQIGRHTFCHMENGKNDCGTFKFVHVWKKQDGDWKLARVISYGH